MTEPDDPGRLQQLQAELARLRLLADNVPVAVAYYRASDDTCLLANRGYAALFGLAPEDLPGRTFASVVGAEAANEIRPYVDRVHRERRRAVYERQVTARDGLTRHLEVQLLPHVDPQDGLSGVFVLVADITRHRRVEQSLRRSEERLAKFMAASAEGIVFHKGGFITDVNPPLLHLLGYALEEMMGRRTLEFVAPEERDKVAAVIASGSEITYDSVALHKDGHPIPVEFIVRTMEHQETQQRMTIVRDRRDRVEAERRIHHLAHHDSLTGLPNRTTFDERLRQLIAAHAAGEPGFALLFIDLDHFKRVNDSLGHAVGDLLLHTLGRRIAAAVRAHDLVARFGGDEFVVVLGGAPSAADAGRVAESLLATISDPITLQGQELAVTPSIGVALCPEHGHDAATLVKHADTAMYRAKARGRSAWALFEPAMAEAAMAELALETRLAQAVRDCEFVLHYQPQLSLRDGRVVGLEALIRWAHPERGLLMPGAFLAVAESRRLILPLGHWVLDQALRDAARWRAAGLLAAPVAVNLASAQFRAPGFVDSVRQALRAHGLPGAALELELTERMLMEDAAEEPGHANRTLQQIKAMGVRLSVDDFGTGYSSLGHLRDLPIDRLKIDRSFIHDLPAGRGSAAIARAIVQMGDSLGLGVVAEGVEHDAQLAWCREQGGLDVQGFLTGRPMPADALERWLVARQASKA
ncbi:MAG: putative bifunctional diguanylate cyclase/phosphodiesterase [Rubrivivax sp.]